jgi:hypothetical protein
MLDAYINNPSKDAIPFLFFFDRASLNMRVIKPT